MLEGGWPYKARRKQELLWDSRGGNWSNTSQIRPAASQGDTHTHIQPEAANTFTHIKSNFMVKALQGSMDDIVLLSVLHVRAPPSFVVCRRDRWITYYSAIC